MKKIEILPESKKVAQMIADLLDLNQVPKLIAVEALMMVFIAIGSSEENKNPDA